MQAMQHQMMGYDRGVTMFSPDGRLLQVEYAKKTVKQGSTAIGIACKDGVVLVADKRIMDKLVVPESVEKTWQIDDHIAATAAGILSDARVLIERAQVNAQQHRMTYNSPVDIPTVVKDICTLKQVCTQSAGLRPFGVSMLIAGVDKEGPKLFETDPTGVFFRYKATAIGEGDTEINEMLEKEYKESITVDEGLKLAVKALVKITNGEIDANRINASVVGAEDKTYKKVSKHDVEAVLKEAKK